MDQCSGEQSRKDTQTNGDISNFLFFYAVISAYYCINSYILNLEII